MNATQDKDALSEQISLSLPGGQLAELFQRAGLAPPKRKTHTVWVSAVQRAKFDELVERTGRGPVAYQDAIARGAALWTPTGEAARNPTMVTREALMLGVMAMIAELDGRDAADARAKRRARLAAHIAAVRVALDPLQEDSGGALMQVLVEEYPSDAVDEVPLPEDYVPDLPGIV